MARGKHLIQNGYLAFALRSLFNSGSVAATAVPHYPARRGSWFLRSGKAVRFGGFLGLCSSAGVGVAINVKQARRVHLRINLCRRQARMAEQFLERAQVGSPGK